MVWIIAVAVVVAACNADRVEPKVVPSVPVAPPKAAPSAAHGVAVALVLLGHELWMGNDELEPEIDPTDPAHRRPNPAHMRGVLNSFKAALRDAPLASDVPGDAKGLVVTYSDKAEVTMPVGPLAALLPEMLGMQKHYYRRGIGTALVRGVELAMAELEKLSVRKKVMIVFGDGADTDRNAALDQLETLRKRAAGSGIEVRAFIYKGPTSDRESPITRLTPHVVTFDAVSDAGLVVEALHRAADPN